MSVNHSPYPVAMKEHLCVHPVCRRDVPVYLFQNQYTELVEKWTDHLKHIAWQITRNKQAAEDIVQEAFLELWLQRVKIIPDNPVGWLLKVVSNLSKKHIRKTCTEIRIHNRLSNHYTIVYSDVEEKLIGKEKEITLHNAFSKLPTQQQLVLHLSKEEGLHRQEIAERLHLSPNTVKVHLLRAVKFMKVHAGCFLLFVIFFACNNIFSKSSNTNHHSGEYFSVQQFIREQLFEKKSVCITQELTAIINR